jgi:riboflavin synthase
MFSGIIEEVGVVAGRAGSRLQIGTHLCREGLRVGDSIAVNGACLTAVAIGRGEVSVDISPETAARTTLASLLPGTRVNLERALRLDGRLGGHFVQGHIDGVGHVESLKHQAGFALLTLVLPPPLLPFCVEKGSLAVDGISLTIADLEGDRVRISLVPHTLAVTTASGYRPATAVNLEVDILAKLVAAQLGSYRAALDARATH